MSDRHSQTRRAAMKGRLSALHDEEGGAIMMAALAGTLILFMISLALYDAGNLARNKVVMQTSADTAAYSQAAIKARTMNSNAYANVAKRSIVGMAQVYHASYSLFYRAIADAAQLCSKDPDDPDKTACAQAFSDPCANTNLGNGGQAAAGGGAGSNCGSNWEIIFFESVRDWDDIETNGTSNRRSTGGYPGIYEAQSPIPPRVVARVGSYNVEDKRDREITGVMGKYNKELQQLTRYQEYMQKVTPWWSFMESIARATHNGATAAVSFPPPPSLNTNTLPSWVTVARTQMKTSGAPVQTSGYEDWKWRDPTLGRDVSLATNIRTPWNNDQNLDNLRAPGNLKQRLQRSSDALELCHSLRANPAQGAPLYDDDALGEEMQYNYELMRDLSEGDASNPVFAGAFFLEDDQQFGVIGGYSLCVMDMLGSTVGEVPANTPWRSLPDYNANRNQFVPVLNPYFAGPYIVMVERDQSALDMLRLSNIVFTYKEGKRVKEGRKRFSYLSPDYSTSLPDDAKGAGTWTMARSEIVTQGKSNSRKGRVWASGEWHTNWTARLRPVSFENEMRDLANDLGDVQTSFINAAFYDAFPFMGLAQQEGLTRDFDQNQLIEDLRFMERATQALDDGSSGGLTK